MRVILGYPGYRSTAKRGENTHIEAAETGTERAYRRTVFG
jgi:hypothetical protein